VELACAVVVTHILTLLLCVVLGEREAPGRPGLAWTDDKAAVMSLDRAGAGETVSFKRGDVRQYTLNHHYTDPPNHAPLR